MDNNKDVILGKIRNAKGHYRVTPDTNTTGHIDVLESGTWTTITDPIPDSELNMIIIEISNKSVSTSSKDVGKKSHNLTRGSTSSAAKIING